MPQRIAAIFGLTAFSACLLIGGLGAGNTFSTTVSRAIVALAGSYVIGLILGHVARKLLDENLKQQESALRNQQKPQTNDR